MPDRLRFDVGLDCTDFYPLNMEVIFMKAEMRMGAVRKRNGDSTHSEDDRDKARISIRDENRILVEQWRINKKSNA